MCEFGSQMSYAKCDGLNIIQLVRNAFALKEDIANGRLRQAGVQGLYIYCPTMMIVFGGLF